MSRDNQKQEIDRLIGELDRISEALPDHEQYDSLSPSEAEPKSGKGEPPLDDIPLIGEFKAPPAKKPGSGSRKKANPKKTKAELRAAAKAAEKKRMDKASAKLGPVSAAELLGEVRVLLRKHIVMPWHSVELVSLYVVLTWFINAVDYLPILYLTSPEPRCGKSTLLKIMRWLVWEAKLASSITASSLFRLAAEGITALLDETDNLLLEPGEIVAFLNSSVDPDTPFTRTNREQGFAVEDFHVYGCRVLAGIGDLPKQLAALSDRCMTVRLERKGKKDRVERVISRRLKLEAEPMRLRLYRLAGEHADEVRKCYEGNELLELLSAEQSLDDRSVDAWLSLMSVAELCGRREQALSAARMLAGEGKPSESNRIALLRAMQHLYFPDGDDGPVVEWLSSEYICEELNKDKDELWCGWNSKSKEPGIQPRNIASVLKPFGIKPGQKRTEPGRGGARDRGYSLEKLKKAFSSYIPEIIRDTVTHSVNPFPSSNNGVTDDQKEPPKKGEPEASVTPEVVDGQSTYGMCHGVTDKNPDMRENGNLPFFSEGENQLKKSSERNGKKSYSPPTLTRIPIAEILRPHGGGLDCRALEIAIRRETGVSAVMAEGAVELALELKLVAEKNGRICLA